MHRLIPKYLTAYKPSDYELFSSGIDGFINICQFDSIEVYEREDKAKFLKENGKILVAIIGFSTGNLSKNIKIIENYHDSSVNEYDLDDLKCKSDFLKVLNSYNEASGLNRNVFKRSLLNILANEFNCSIIKDENVIEKIKNNYNIDTSSSFVDDFNKIIINYVTAGLEFIKYEKRTTAIKRLDRLKKNIPGIVQDIKELSISTFDLKLLSDDDHIPCIDYLTNLLSNLEKLNSQLEVYKEKKIEVDTGNPSQKREIINRNVFIRSLADLYEKFTGKSPVFKSERGVDPSYSGEVINFIVDCLKIIYEKLQQVPSEEIKSIYSTLETVCSKTSVRIIGETLSEKIEQPHN